MEHSGQKARSLMKKLNNDPKQRNSPNIITSDQIAHQHLTYLKQKRSDGNKPQSQNESHNLK